MLTISDLSQEAGLPIERVKQIFTDAGVRVDSDDQLIIGEHRIIFAQHVAQCAMHHAANINYR